ncbi:mechanosensitive ion channel family protein [Parasphingorhabdus sp. DH2-15]|uniref:mechanosensitive ion channel family protein n=1 Tax=Parasphingorhabdus sp. DH2-15 TaxID=3444112 RepID=UPI003F68952B
MIAGYISRFQDLMGETPRQLQYTEAGIAAGLTILAITMGWMLSRTLGPKLAALWEARAGYESEIARNRIRDMVRRTIEASLVATLLYLHGWSLIAEVILSLTLAISTGLLVNDFVRGIRLPNWLGTLLGLIIFFSIATSFIDGITGLTTALDRVGFDVGERRISLLSITTILLTFSILVAIVRLASRVITHSINNTTQFDAGQKLLIQKIATIVLVIAAFFIGMDLLGIDLTALSFFSGAFGLAVGFGLQKTIGNLFAGIILLMDRSIKPGDIIVVGDSFGWVNKIGVRAVSVLTRDGKEHLIPNEDLMTKEVENWSYSSNDVRMKIPIGVSYKSDMRLVQKLLYKAVEESPRILRNPAAKVWMLEFGDNSVNFEIRAWINDPQEGVGNVRADVMMRVWDLFQEHDIEIPFPQRDLHLKGMADAGDLTKRIKASQNDDAE